MDESLHFLDMLAREDADWVLRQSEAQTVLAEKILVTAGSQPTHLYFVTEGLFDVYAPGVTSRVNRISRGALIGEIAWVERQPATATVKALESSEVLALPIAGLDSKLRDSPEMASRFNAALARVLAGRLRRATARLASAQDSRDLKALPGTIDSLLEEFKAAVVRADRHLLEHPEEVSVAEEDLMPRFEKLWRNFDAVIRALPDDGSREALGSVAQREMLPYLLVSRLAERSYTKPRGYAGDYLTIEWMYEDRPTGVGRVGPIIDKAFLSFPAVVAVKNRRQLLARLIADALDRSPGRPVHITALACGPAREVFDVFDGPRGADARARLFVTCLDIDADALALVEKRVRECGLASNISTIRANLIHVSTGRQTVEQPPQDLIYSIGLIDYFADSFVVRLMDWMYQQLGPGGSAVLGNFVPESSSKALMDYVFDWRLIHRSPADMDRLYRQSKFGRSSTQVHLEAQRVNLFAECTKQ